MRLLFYLILTIWLCGFKVKAQQAPQLSVGKTLLKAKQALKFCKQKGFNTQYCLLADLSMPSGTKRFIAWDFPANKAFLTAMVSHGCGKEPWSGVWSKEETIYLLDHEGY